MTRRTSKTEAPDSGASTVLPPAPAGLVWATHPELDAPALIAERAIGTESAGLWRRLPKSQLKAAAAESTTTPDTTDEGSDH